MTMEISIVRRVLEKNDAAADQNRALFNRSGITCVNLLGGAGCGKTALLEALLPRLRAQVRIGVLEGDLATTLDAQRIADLSVPAVQLLTDTGCHLTAAHVQKALKSLDLNEIDLLVIENVGNPICPANFDLGEHIRLAALSVSEGDDKPVKYPLLFRQADLVTLTKCDLLPYVRFDLARVHRDLGALNPAAAIIETSATTGRGIDILADWLQNRLESSGRSQRAKSRPGPVHSALLETKS